MTDYVLASEGIINRILHFNIGVEVISSHTLLLLWLENIIADTHNNTNTCQAQLQKLIRHIWNDNYKFIVTERMNDTIGRIYVYGTQDAITKGRVDEEVNMLNAMIRTAGREM